MRRKKRGACGASGESGSQGKFSLQLLEELTGRAGDVHAARRATLAILDALDDAGGLGALGAIGALGGVHHFFAVTGLGNLGHTNNLLKKYLCPCNPAGITQLRRARGVPREECVHPLWGFAGLRQLRSRLQDKFT